MAGEEPIASASIDVRANVDKLSGDMDKAKAIAATKAKEAEAAVAASQATKDAQAAAELANKEIREYAATQAIATEAADRMAASQTKAATATKQVGDSANASEIKIAAIAGAASAAAASLSRAYTALKAFGDSANQLGKDLGDISAAFGAIAAVQLDAVSAQVNAVEKLAAAQRQAVHEQEVSRNILEDIVEYANDNASSTVRLNQIESERASTLTRIAQQEKDAAEAKKEQERAANEQMLMEGRALMFREQSRLARQDEIEQEKKLAEAAQNRIDLERKLQEEQRKTQEQMAAAIAQAVSGAQQQIAAIFKSDEIVVAIENLGEIVSAINTKASRLGSGD